MLFGIVGSSEENIRKAIHTVEAVAPSILRVEEIEKGFAGTKSDGDSGTSARVFGTFLTWMQDKMAPVFVIVTSNDVSSLPPELLRKGHFDEIFFVDMPTSRGRENIFRLRQCCAVVSSELLGVLHLFCLTNFFYECSIYIYYKRRGCDRVGYQVRRLPDAELEVMQAVWDCVPPVSRADIERVLLDKHHLAPTTILTLLTRLTQRGALTLSKLGRSNVYSPVFSREEYLASQSSRFLNKLCGGDLAVFANALCDSGLSREEVEELRRLLQEGML